MTCSILVQFPSNFFSIHFVSIHVVHLYSNIHTTAAWKKFCFDLSDRAEFHMIDGLLIAIYAFARCLSYLPTPPLGQDMTQGQFFKRSLTGLNSEFSFS